MLEGTLFLIERLGLKGERLRGSGSGGGWRRRSSRYERIDGGTELRGSKLRKFELL
jgi:hypothetical protein